MSTKLFNKANAALKAVNDLAEQLDALDEAIGRVANVQSPPVWQFLEASADGGNPPIAVLAQARNYLTCFRAALRANSDRETGAIEAIIGVGMLGTQLTKPKWVPSLSRVEELRNSTRRTVSSAIVAYPAEESCLADAKSRTLEVLRLMEVSIRACVACWQLYWRLRSETARDVVADVGGSIATGEKVADRIRSESVAGAEYMEEFIARLCAEQAEPLQEDADPLLSKIREYSDVTDRHSTSTQETNNADSPKHRPAYDRDHLFLAWYNAEGSDTYHSHATIAQTWNSIRRSEREGDYPQSPGSVTREVVIEAIKKATKESDVT